jgi:hypothetical protein
LVAELERLKTGRGLHLTHIRNEHAYFSYVAELVRHRAKAAVAAASEPGAPPAAATTAITTTTTTTTTTAAGKVYVLGDSHALAPAWETVTWGGRKCMLEPRLATGVKAWHLRPGATFYPKHAFAAAAESIPDAQTVIVVLGEIDCREGLLLAVEKDRYADLAQAVSETAAVLVAALRGLQAKRKWRILVHPVPPVLDETRPIVSLFNRELQRQVQREPSLCWLDFFDHLLDDREGLKAELRLDGTHLHPRYVKTTLQPALERVEQCDERLHSSSRFRMLA